MIVQVLIAAKALHLITQAQMDAAIAAVTGPTRGEIIDLPSLPTFL